MNRVDGVCPSPDGAFCGRTPALGRAAINRCADEKDIFRKARDKNNPDDGSTGEPAVPGNAIWLTVRDVRWAGWRVALPPSSAPPPGRPDP